MHLHAFALRLSPSDLSSFLGCRHRTGLDLAVAHGALAKPVWNDPLAEALRERGAEHERAYVETLRAEGLDVVEIQSNRDEDARTTATINAMRAGVHVIVQAALKSDGWIGFADVLRRVDTPSALGGWSYEPHDTKLARETRGGTILQLAAYAELLEGMQGVRPERFHVVTPVAVHTYRFADYAAYFRIVRRQLAETLARGHDAILDSHYPEPVDQCDVCRWWARCNTRRRQDDHLSFIAGIGRLHRDELRAQGYPTLAAAAAMAVPLAFKPSRGSQESYLRLREQARLQHEQRTLGRPVHELLPIVEGQGLARLPEPSRGDLFLDLEGARFAREGGREYLFGLWRKRATDDDALYDGVWACTDAEERAAFESIIDRVIRAWDSDPGMHVYHFGHYEPSALKRLMGRYATRGDEIDRLLRGERLINLHTVVRQTLRAGVESYSIKQLEPFYGFVRDVDLRNAALHLSAVELALEGSASSILADETRAAVEGYNRDDCRSTEALRDWLERLRAELVDHGTSVPRPTPKKDEASEQVGDLEARQQAARARLLEGLPPEAATPGDPGHPKWLLAYLVDWHRREDKSAWWERFRLSELPEADLFEEPQAIAGLEYLDRLSEERYKNGKLKAVVDRYRYPMQETEIRRGDKLRVPGDDPIGEVAAHDRLARLFDIAKGRVNPDFHPAAVFTAEVFSTTSQQEALLRIADSVDEQSCGTDLLFRRPPRVPTEFRQREEETTAAFAVRVALKLDRTTLAIQGPPGSGKTYVGAQMIRALVRAGKKVGVTAVSHKVIRNLLDAIRAQESAAADTSVTSPKAPPILLGHKRDRDDVADDAAHVPVVEYGDNADALGALAAGQVHVLGGTSWLWSREDAVGAVDVLFVDEAGQISLANALAVSRAAQSLVLLGDPQQLEQPQKGSHPDGVGISALEHVLGGALTMPADRGLFLPTTWRLAPAICRFTSELFYDGRLQSKTGLERQRLAGTGVLDGAGLWWLPIAHDGNQNHSIEEVEAVAALVDRLLAPGAVWIDENDVARQLTGNDLRIVAPFNAQVNRLNERLAGRGVPIGTVDKFQGQEAPVVIYSMATSRPEDAPRGMEFLYSLNRLNVATSRARCVAIVVASPRLCEPSCRTPRQMLLANAMCRYRELAREVAGRSPSS